VGGGGGGQGEGSIKGSSIGSWGLLGSEKNNNSLFELDSELIKNCIYFEPVDEL
jgi:hypothetical protein